MVLIDGDRLADRMHQELCGDVRCVHCTFRADDGGCKVERWLDKAPIVKPKQGEWIDRTTLKGFSEYECSACHAYGQQWMTFCPHCGCRMKGADDED